MRKLKLFLTLLLVAFLGYGQVWATEVTWPGSTALPANFTNINNDANVQIKVSSTNDNANPIRVYANTTITIKVADGYTIESVRYEASSTGNYVTYAQGATVSPSVTPSVSGKNVTWSFSSTTAEFTFKPSSQTRTNGITVVYSSTSGGGNSTPSDQTFDLTKKTYTTGTNKVTWSNTYVTIENSGNNATNYLGGDSNNRTSSRFYANNSLTITPASGYTISTVEFSAMSDNYATILGTNSTWTNASASVTNSKVTVTPTNGASAISATVNTTCGFSSIVVKFAASGSGSSDPTLSLTQSNNAVTSLSLDGVDVTTQTIGLTASNFGEDVASVTTGLYNNADCADNHAITSGAWITNITVNDAKTQVSFGAADNESLTDSRQCWLKITASGATKSASAVLPITQAKAPLSTMQQIFDNAPSTAANKDIKFNSAWVISGVKSDKKTAYLTDGTRGLILYNSNTNNLVGNNLAVGNTLSGTVSRSLLKYNGSAELTGFTITNLTKGTGGSVNVNVLDASQAGELTGANTGSLIQIIGECVVENSKSYIKLTETLKFQLYNGISSYTAPTEGKIYQCTGVYVYDTSYGNEILPRSSSDLVEKTCEVNPSLGATTVDGISQTGATLHSAGITAIGDYCEITSYGFDYSVNSDFSNATHVQVGTAYTTANTAFQYEIASSSLTPGTKYYVRAYATNGYGTAYAVLENGFTTEAATTPTITVTANSHNFNQVLTTTNAQTWKFTVNGANLTENVTISGASDPISLSSYLLAYADVNGDGVEVTVTLTPNGAATVNQTLTLSSAGATEVTVTIQASVVAPYAVTFHVPAGLTAPAAQSITPGEAADLTVAPTGSLATCTFLGWVEDEYTEQTAAISPLASYTPTGDVDLYALFRRVDGQDFNGYALSVEFGNSTQYVGAYNSSKSNFNVAYNLTDAEVFGLDESGYIYAYINGSKKYLKSANDTNNKGNVVFGDKESSASWTLSEGTPFTITTTCTTTGISGRKFGYNDNGHASDATKTPRFALYSDNGANYSYDFTKIAATKEVGTYYYSTAPVIPELSSIEVTTEPTKKAYFAGDNFDATGMVVTAHYTGGKPDKTVALADLTIDPATNLAANITSVSISYGGKSTTQAITVTAIALESISVANQPTTTTYKVGDTFDPAGLAINAVFNDVTKNRALSSTEYTLSEPDMTTAGQKVITVTAVANNNITTSFNIQVNTELSSITVNTDNAKTVYVEGEEFNPEGIVVTATYTGGSSHEVTGATFNKSGVLKEINELSEPANIEVEVSYTENSVTKTTTYNVTVNPYPRYAVTFNVRGNAGSPVSEESAQGGVSVPEDPATVGEYTFAGWSKTQRAVESADDPALVTITAGKYFPTENTILYAVYTRDAEADVHGMYLTCDIDGNGTNKTIAYFNSNSNSLYPTDNDHSSPLAMWYKDGLLFYMNGENRTYVYNTGGSSANLITTTTKADAVSNAWEKITNEGGTVTFKRADTRILGWNTSTSYFRAYGSTYANKFSVAEATETIMEMIPHYTTAPVMTYAVTYYKNTTDEVENMPTPNPAHTDANGDITLSASIPTRDGKIFNGWNTNALGTGTGYEKEQVLSGLEQDLELYAQWRTPENYTMTYNANGGELISGKTAISPVIVTEGNTHTVKDNVYEVEGKIFTGWKVGDITYAAGEVIEPTSHMEFVAQWNDPILTDFVLVTDVKQLKDGDKVYIVAAGEYKYAMGTHNSGNYRNRVEIDKSDDNHIIEYATAPVEFTLGKGDDYFTFYDGANYVAWSSGNSLKNESEVDNASKWTITISEDVATIANMGNSDRVIQYNSNASGLRFAAYTGSQKPVAIYKRPDYSRDVNAGRYGTICLPKAGKMEGATIYEVAYFDGGQSKIFFDEVLNGEMIAGRPYIFLPNDGVSTLNVYYTDNTVDDASAGNYRGLWGSYTQEPLDANGENYILYNNQYMVVNSGNAYVGENRAYIKMNGTGDDYVPTYATAAAPGRRRVAMGVLNEQVATGMDELNASEAPVKVMIDGQLFIIRGEKMFNANGQLVK